MSRSSPKKPAAAHPSPAPHAKPHARRRIAVPLWAVGITLALLVTAAFSVDPVRDAVTLGGLGEATLGVSAAYLAIAPISNTLDTLTLLTVAQHIAIVLTAIALFAGWRVHRARSTPVAMRRELMSWAAFVGGVLIVYAIAAMAPRPMAAIAVSDETVLAVDFHAHTMYSHDGRRGWSEDDVRDWQRGAGNDAAYITDHATFAGAERGVAANPPVAGEGLMLLQGLEAFFHGEHVNVLSAGRHYRGLTNAALTDVDTEALALASLLARSTPLLIETIPGKLNQMVVSKPGQSNGVQAIELIDGSPRGLTQGRSDRARIIKLADSLDLALVTGSDNHGWGRAVPGWTLMRIPGWRGMRSDSLSSTIELALRDGRRASTRVVERRVAEATNPFTVLLSAVLVPWRMFTTLSADERVMWLIWVWGAVLLLRGWRAYRVRPSITA